MIMRLVLPRYEKVHFLSGICSLFLRKEDEVHYIRFHMKKLKKTFWQQMQKISDGLYMHREMVQ